MPAGERHKTLDTARDLYDDLLAAGIDRTATIIALGCLLYTSRCV